MSLTEIPWLSVQVPKRAPKRGAGSDLQSTMEAPIEAMAGETKSVMVAVGSAKPEKIDIHNSFSSIPKLALPPEDKAVMLTDLYEKSLLCDGGIFECKTISFDDGDVDDVIGSNLDEEIAARKALPPPVTTPRPITPETVNDRGQEIQVDNKGDVIMLAEEDNSLEEKSTKEKPKKSSFSSKMMKKMSIRKKKVSLPTLKKSKSKKAKKKGALDDIEECDEESASYPLAHLANVDSRETEEPPSAVIIAAISNAESGIMDAWDHISRSMTSASTKDFENTSFDCLGPPIMSEMSESQVDNYSEDMSEVYTQNTESEYMSQFTNPSFMTDSYSYDSESTYSDDGYSR